MSCTLGRIAATGSLLSLLPALAIAGESVTVSQSDWSAGRGEGVAVTAWGRSFEAADLVSWRAIPGQLALASEPLDAPLRHVVDVGLDGALKVVAGDLDGDRDSDVVAAAYWDGTIVAWLNDGGEGLTWRSQVIATGLNHAVGLSLADVDRDGRLDILGGAGESGQVAWWRNHGGDPLRWTRHPVDSTFRGAHDIAAADLDGDGDTDLVGAAWEDDQVAWWRNDGGEPTRWIKRVIADGFDYACKVELADVDGDGDPDVVATAWTAQEIRWWRNDGGSPLSWTGQLIASGFTGTHWVDCADVDLDGRIDVLAAAMDRAEVAWWQNDGSSPIGWTKISMTGPLAGAVSVESADLDGDGDSDAAAAGWSASGGIAWWDNRDGGGTSWSRRLVDGSFLDASSVHLADVDGDGALDILATSWTLDRVAWWKVSRFRAGGSLTSSILDCGEAVEWLSWSGDVDRPDGTELLVEVRLGDDPAAMGPWLELALGQPPAFTGEVGRYLQYRLTLSSQDPTASPIVRELSFAGESAIPVAPRPPRRRLPLMVPRSPLPYRRHVTEIGSSGAARRPLTSGSPRPSQVPGGAGGCRSSAAPQPTAPGPTSP